MTAFVPVMQNPVLFMYYYSNIIYCQNMSQLNTPHPNPSLLDTFSTPHPTLEEVLQAPSLLEDYKQGDSQLHIFIHSVLQRLIQMMTIEGPQHDQLRSFAFPQTACDILSCGHSAMTSLLLTPETPSTGSEPICQILDYFQGFPNDVLSGYVIRVVSSLYTLDPVKIQHLIFGRKYAPQMIRFLSSRSVAEFFVNLIAIEDEKLLTFYIDERNQLLNSLIDTYSQQSVGEEEMAQLGYALCEIVKRLWDSEHKESGHFSSTVFRLAQIAIDNNNDLMAYNPDLLPLVIGKYSVKGEEAPFLVNKCADRIIQTLATYQPEVSVSATGQEIFKFGQRNLKLLCSLTTIVTNNVTKIADLLKRSSCFAILMDLIVKYEWNNMVHNEIEKIFKVCMECDSPTIYSAIFETGLFVQRITGIISMDSANNKDTRGYTGVITNILSTLANLPSSTARFQKLKRTHLEFERTVTCYLSPKMAQNSCNLGGCRLQIDYTIPQYNDNDLMSKYKGFFEEDAIVIDHAITANKEILDEIMNERQLNLHWGVRA